MTAATSRGRHEPLEEHVLEPVEVVDMPERRVVDARQERTEAGVVGGLGGRQRERPHGAPVEAAQEGDDGRPAGGTTGQLERGLHGLRAAVAQEDAHRAGHGRGARDGLAGLRRRWAGRSQRRCSGGAASACSWMARTTAGWP